MTKKDFKNKRVTVVGLGLHGGGLGTVKFLADAGAKVLVTDIKNRDELEPSVKALEKYKVEFVLGQHRPEDFTQTDLIVRNPAVPLNFKYFDLAQQHKIPITNDLALFMQLCPAKTCGVTGTKGKSTTAKLLALMLEKHLPVVLAGNIGVSALATLNQITPETLVILEMSSWQLEDLALIKKSPGVAVITNVTEDHLNRHGNVADYKTAKSAIFANQGQSDLLILNYDDPNSKDFAASAKSQVYYYSARHDLAEIIADASRYKIGAFKRQDMVVFGENAAAIFDPNQITIPGKHNLENALAAATTARLLGASTKSIQAALKNFTGLPGRLQAVATVNNRTFVNDTTATNPTAAAAALRALDPQNKRTVVLIAGGQGKNLSPQPLIKALSEHARFVALLPGDASDEIYAILQDLKTVPHLMATSLQDAVEESLRRSIAGDTIVLSPAATSFNSFKNEFDRGEQFEAIVKRL